MDETKIVLPQKLQIEMLRFFLKTSIPRKKRQNADSQPTDRRDEK
jgi:hypothetical protein